MIISSRSGPGAVPRKPPIVPGTRENLKEDSPGRHGGSSVRSGGAVQPRWWRPAAVDQPTRLCLHGAPPDVLQGLKHRAASASWIPDKVAREENFIHILAFL